MLQLSLIAQNNRTVPVLKYYLFFCNVRRSTNDWEFEKKKFHVKKLSGSVNRSRLWSLMERMIGPGNKHSLAVRQPELCSLIPVQFAGLMERCNILPRWTQLKSCSRLSDTTQAWCFFYQTEFTEFSNWPKDFGYLGQNICWRFPVPFEVFPHKTLASVIYFVR